MRDFDDHRTLTCLGLDNLERRTDHDVDSLLFAPPLARARKAVERFVSCRYERAKRQTSLEHISNRWDTTERQEVFCGNPMVGARFEV